MNESVQPEATTESTSAAIKTEATQAPNWERTTLEKLAMAALVEQRSARRWRNGIRLAWLGFFALLLWVGMGKSGSTSDITKPHTAVVEIKGEIASGADASADLVVSAMDDAEGGSKYVPDAMSAEYAVGAFEAMLPSTLQAAEPARKSIQSEKAASEISQMLLTYADVAGTSDDAKASARSAATKLKEAAGNARPILEISHDLWTQYRKREGQPLDQFISSEKGIEADMNGPLDFLPCAKMDGGCTIA